MDLLNLKIIALSKQFRDLSLERDLEVYHLSRSGLESLRIINGMIVLDSIITKKYFNAINFPLVDRKLKKIMNRNLVSSLFVPQDEFEKVVNEFIMVHFLAKVEKDIEDPKEYLVKKQNMPLDNGDEDDSYKEQQEVISQLEKMIRKDPNYFGLPREIETFSEVRLDSRFSRLCANYEEYAKFKEEDYSLNHSLGICDMVAVDGQNNFYILEFKCSLIRFNEYTLMPKMEEAKRQLVRSLLFFQYNFNVNPHLIYILVEPKKEVPLAHIHNYNYNGGKLETIKNHCVKI